MCLRLAGAFAPYANLAVIGYDRGEEAEAARLLDRAHALGNRNLTQVAARERGNILRSMRNLAR
jgi:hypothetical protein